MIDFDLDDDGIVTLTWDMPDRRQNVLHQASMAAFSEALDRIEATDGVTGVVITSGKRDFIAGADLSMLESLAFGEEDDPEVLYDELGTLGGLLRRLETLGVPSVAAIPGVAMGGGLELCLACTRRIASDSPRVRLGLPEVTLGLLPGAGGTQRLPRMIGIPAALPLLLQGTRLRADKALKLGVIDAVVPHDTLLDEAKAWLRTGPDATRPWDVRGFTVPGGGPRDRAIGNRISAAIAMTQAETQGNYPAPKAILSCVTEGCRVDLDTGLELEKRHFVSLLLDPVAGNMIRTLFLNMQRANKLVRRPAGVDRFEVTKVGVLGAGLMGSGIATVAAQRGAEVVVIDTTDDKAAGAVAYAERVVGRAVSRGRLDEAGAAEVIGRIHPSTDHDDLAGCDVVIEAVFEDRAVKAAVTRSAEARLAPTALFASNTSTLPITGLAEASARPGRFVGLHFFSPVEKMKLVEVIVGEATTDETLAHALDVVKALGKTPIVVRDSRGFYTSRVFSTYITEGLAMLREGIAPALIEHAGRMASMPMPPLAIADEVGIGLMHAIRRQTRADLGDDAPDHPADEVIATMVEELERAGRRSGGGFYEYGEQGKRLWPGLGEHFPACGVQPPVDTLIERLLTIQCLETARCLEEGVLLAPEDADVGAILGWGFAPWTGGPVSAMDTEGATSIVRRAESLAEAHGARFAPPEILMAMAVEGGCFYDDDTD